MEGQNMSGTTTAVTGVSSGSLHTLIPMRRTCFNRAFAAVYTCAIVVLLYNHAKTLILHSTTSLSFYLTLSLLLSDLVLAFMWFTTQSFWMRPVRRKEFPEKLNKVVKSESDFPALDVFICTADPYKEPPMRVVNTALSVMGYDYPAEKVSVYVSDDGGSELTLFAFMEAAKFAGHWLPFCRKNSIVERCPEVYFSSNQPLSSKNAAIKKMYDSMKLRVENMVKKGKVGNDYISTEEELKIFQRWTHEFTSQDHPTVVQVLLENGRDKDITGHGMPNLIYVSREKRTTVPHHFKAGALNVLIRVSAVMTNAPIILTLDCDMYLNDPQTPLRALCYLSDPTIQSKLAFVQFPQIFHGTNKDDIYVCEHKRLFQINCMGLDGLQGTNHYGTGYFFRRRALFRGSSSFQSLKNSNLIPNHVVNNPINAQPILDIAHQVATCNYENNTKWGNKVSELRFFIYVFLFLGAYGQDLFDFVLAGGTVQRWWNDQRMWLFRGLTCYLFGIVEFILKSLGISKFGFTITNKVFDDNQIRMYEQGKFVFGVSSPMFVPLATAAMFNLLSLSFGIFQVVRGNSNLDEVCVQMLLASFAVVNCWPIYKAMVLRSDKGMMPRKISLVSTLLVWAIYILT